MNQLIKRLDKQAKLWAIYNTNFPISSHIPAGYTEKFAELIVKECANYCYGEDSLDAKSLKKHFGVEE